MDGKEDSHYDDCGVPRYSSPGISFSVSASNVWMQGGFFWQFAVKLNPFVLISSMVQKSTMELLLLLFFF